MFKESRIPRRHCYSRSRRSTSQQQPIQSREIPKENSPTVHHAAESCSSDDNMDVDMNYVDYKDVGHWVLVGGVQVGILRYIGPASFSAGMWCGVELQRPLGKNDGSVQGRRYFICAPGHGIMAPLERIQRMPQQSIPSGLNTTFTVPPEHNTTYNKELESQETTATSSSNDLNHRPRDLHLNQEEKHRPKSPLQFQIGYDVHDEDYLPSPPPELLMSPDCCDWLAEETEESSLGILTPSQMREFSCFGSLSRDPSLDFGVGTNRFNGDSSPPLIPEELSEIADESVSLSSDTTNQSDIKLANTNDTSEVTTADETLSQEATFETHQTPPPEKKQRLSPQVESVSCHLALVPNLSVKSSVQSDRIDIKKCDISTEEVDDETEFVNELTTHDSATALETDEPDLLTKDDVTTMIPMTTIAFTTDSTIISSTTSSTRICDMGASVTSVTCSFASVTSLDAGYQGDFSEAGSPSRELQPSPIAPMLVAIRLEAHKFGAVDTAALTDSDFCSDTCAGESEVEAEMDPLVTRDRKAQVIDGTLYSSSESSGICCRNRSNSEMDSSGVFSEVERFPDEPVNEELLLVPDLEGTDDSVTMGPDDSVDTSTTYIQEESSTQDTTVICAAEIQINDQDDKEDSPKQEDSTFVTSGDRSSFSETVTSSAQLEVTAGAALTKQEQGNKLEASTTRSSTPSKLSPRLQRRSGGSTASTTASRSKKREPLSQPTNRLTQSEGGNDENGKGGSVGEKENTRPSPSAAQESNVKANVEIIKQHRNTRRVNKWAAVMDKINQSKEEEKKQPSRSKLKEVKSKVFANLGPPVTLKMPPRSRSDVTSNEKNMNKQRKTRESFHGSRKSPRLATCSSSTSVMGNNKTNHHHSRLPSCVVGGSVETSPHSSTSDVSDTERDRKGRNGNLKKLDNRPSSQQSDMSSLSATSHDSRRSRVRSTLPHHPNSTPRNRKLQTSVSTLRPALRRTERERNPSGQSLPTKPTPLKANGLRIGNGSVADHEKMVAQLWLHQRQLETEVVTTKHSHTNGGTHILQDLNRLPVTPLTSSPGKSRSALKELVATNKSLEAELVRLREEIKSQREESERVNIDLEYAHKGTQAMAVLVDYLTHTLGAFSLPALLDERKKQDEMLCEKDNVITQLNNKMDTCQVEWTEINRVHTEENNTLLEGNKVLLKEKEEMNRDQCDMKKRIRLLLQQIEDLRTEHEKQLCDQTSAYEKEQNELEEKCRLCELHEEQLLKQLQEMSTIVNKDDSVLAKEVQSLKAVYELKATENRELKLRNMELEQQVEKFPSLVQKLQKSQQRVEDLQLQVNRKIQFERQLSNEKYQLQESFEKGLKEKMQLAQQNEELQWKLQQSMEGSFTAFSNVNKSTVMGGDGVVPENLFPIISSHLLESPSSGLRGSGDFQDNTTSTPITNRRNNRPNNISTSQQSWYESQNGSMFCHQSTSPSLSPLSPNLPCGYMLSINNITRSFSFPSLVVEEDGINGMDGMTMSCHPVLETPKDGAGEEMAEADSDVLLVTENSSTEDSHEAVVNIADPMKVSSISLPVMSESTALDVSWSEDGEPITSEAEV